MKVLLENLLRYEDGRTVTDDDIEAGRLAEERRQVGARSPIARRAC